jgi:hypothetical protein
MALTPEAEASETPKAAPMQPTRPVRPSPAWVFGVWVASLAFVFVGERVLVTTPSARWTATGLGLIGLVATLALRIRRTRQARDAARTTERSFVVFSAIGLAAVALYFATLDLSSLAPQTRARVESLSTNVWVSAVLLSTLPQLFGQLALEPMRLAERVEWRRVRDALGAGLVVAMTCISATLFTYAAGDLGLRADFSYFRTARPSDSTVKTAQSLTQPLRVITFFPPASEVRSEVHGYLRDLARQAKTVTLEEADRLASPKLAKELGVTQDGSVVLERGAERQTLVFPLAVHEARPKLKAIDADFQKALAKVLKNRRTVYLTVGHGELNDTKATPDKDGRSATGFKELLERFNYHLRDLSPARANADVPDDATVVAILGPLEPFSEQDLLALERYAARGGHLFIALEPDGKEDGERLAGMFGLKWNKTILCDDRTFAVRRMNDSDHAIILTNRFSSHASVATLSRLGSRAVFFLGSGSLTPAGGSAPHADFIARSLPSTFADKNGNFKFDPGEERTSYNLAAAVSKPPTAPPAPASSGAGEKPGEPPETRAVILADSDTVSDAALMNGSLANGNPQFVADIAKWLGGEESSIGAIADTGEDVKIEHTKQKDTLLFYATIFGAPLVVLALGLLYTRRVRGRLLRRAA